MPTNTFTAPKAYITIENQPAGYIRTINFTENIQRVPVRGLGSLYAQEVPAVSGECTFNVEQFFIDFRLPVVKKLLDRTGGAEALKNTLIIGEIPMSINIYKKEIQTQDANTKLITEIDKTGTEIAVLRNCFINSQNWSLTEGGIASLGTTGQYLTPVSFNP